MFRQLQKSFVKSAMLSFTIVLFVVLVIVNGINYRQTIEQVDRVATMLVENNGTFPDAPANEAPKERPSLGKPIGHEFRKDDQLSTRYAVVKVENNEVTSVDKSHLISVEESS